MKHIVKVDISKNRTHFIAEDAGKSLVIRGETLHELIENLEFAIEELMPDPDKGLELTAKAKQRLAYAKREIASGRKSKGIALEEIIKKYGLENQV